MKPKLLNRFLLFNSGLEAFYYRSMLLFSFILLITIQGHSQTGITIVVNTLGDAEDFNEFDGVCDSDPGTPGGQCTFRAAIQHHNANRQLDLNRIDFEIANAPGTGSIVINVGSTGLGALPPILGAVHIQALNSTGSGSDTRNIELDGSQAGAGAIGLQLLGGDCKITHFIIHSFSSHGIFISGTGPPGEGGHWLGNMRIGTNADGSEDKGNGGDGIFIEDTPDNLIGGSEVIGSPETPLPRGNLISGNGGYGIRILGRDPELTGRPTSGAPNNRIEGNVIGFDELEQTVFPNDQGGILIDNARNVSVGGLPDAPTPAAENTVVLQQQSTDKGNKIAGEKTGITVSGSLSKGVRVEGNTIGKDGTAAKFLIGILARPGELFSASANFLTNIGDAAIDCFFDANSNYVIKNNQVNGRVKTGTIIKFAENRVIDVVYQANFHTQNGTGLAIEESLRSTINWTLIDNKAQNGDIGGSFTFRAAGNKNFTNNNWDFNTGVGMKFFNQITSEVKAVIIVNGDIATGNGAEGLFFRMQLEAGADLTVRLLKVIGTSNGKDGLSVGLGASGIATGVLELGEGSQFGFNAGIGVRVFGETFSIDFFKVFIEKTTANDNIEDGFLLIDIKSKFSVTDNVITNNGGAGIHLGGNSEVRIANNSISGNGIGILTDAQSFGTISSNIITGNGKAVVLGGIGFGMPLSGNLIFNNIGLGIDLGNDGVTLNDASDTDNGPNNLQNFPVLTSISSESGNTTIDGSLHSTPNTTFKLEFYSNTACNTSGFGEGQTFLSSFNVTTDATGNSNFSASLTGVTVSKGAFVTATATDPNNNSSEFSACLLVGGVPQSADLELTKVSDKTQLTVGEQLTFTVTISNKGPDATTNVTVQDLAPAGITFNQITPDQGSFDVNTGVWTVGTLISGGHAELSISATATLAGTIVNTAEVTASDLPDPDSAPNNGVATEDDQSTISLVVEDAVVSPAGQIKQLMDKVNELESSSELSGKEARKLLQDLENSLHQVNKGHTKQAIHKLESFIKEVQQLVKKGRLTSEEGQELMGDALEIIQQLQTELPQPPQVNNLITLKDQAIEQQNAALKLYANAPNPFSNATTISFELAKQSKVRLMVYDQSGKVITTLLDKVVSPGFYRINWEPNKLSAGVYILYLKAGNSSKAHRMVYIR